MRGLRVVLEWYLPTLFSARTMDIVHNVGDYRQRAVDRGCPSE